MSGKLSTNGYLLLGALGSLIFYISDNLMSYGDPTPISNKVGLYTVGISQIPGWRNNLSMITSFLSVIPFVTALFYLENFIISKNKKTIYHYLIAFSLVAWLLLHFWFISLFYSLHFLTTEGYKDIAIPLSEKLYSHFFWILPTSLIIISIPHVYYLWLIIKGDTILNRYMALFHENTILFILRIIQVFLPESAFKTGYFFSAGNLSSFLYFISLIIYFNFSSKDKNKKQKSN